MFSYGYKPSKNELAYALYNTLYYEDLKNPTSIIKEYIKLGANIHHKMKDGTTLYQSLDRECDKKALKELE